MSGYIKLAEAPALVVQYPTCGACGVDLECEDGWTCPVCGTYWPSDASDGDTGSLYEEWSGETLDSPAVDDDEASRAGMRHEREQRQRMYTDWGLCEHGLLGPHGTCPGGTAYKSTGREQER